MDPNHKVTGGVGVVVSQSVADRYDLAVRDRQGRDHAVRTRVVVVAPQGPARFGFVGPEKPDSRRSGIGSNSTRYDDAALRRHPSYGAPDPELLGLGPKQGSI